MELSENQMHEARLWVAERVKAVISDDQHVCQLVEAHYDGGLEGFANSCNTDFVMDH